MFYRHAPLSAGSVPDRSRGFVVSAFAPHGVSRALVVDRQAEVVAEWKPESVSKNVVVAADGSGELSFSGPRRAAVRGMFDRTYSTADDWDGPLLSSARPSTQCEHRPTHQLQSPGSNAPRQPPLPKRRSVPTSSRHRWSKTKNKCAPARRLWRRCSRERRERPPHPMPERPARPDIPSGNSLHHRAEARSRRRAVRCSKCVHHPPTGSQKR